MKQLLYWSLFVIHIVVTLYFWWQSSGPGLTSGNTDSSLIALGRLSGLVMVSLIFLQVMLMGRARWLEPVFGLDKLARVHRIVGQLILMFLIAHPALLIYAYADVSSVSLWRQFVDFFTNYQDVWQSSIAFLIFLFIIIYSILMVRRKWNFEWWYISHLSVYIAILLSYGHQRKIGGDFLSSDTFSQYWLLVYLFVFGNLLIYRILRPLWLYSKHRFRIEKLVPETKDVTSVYITGNNIDSFKVNAGQFFIVRFLDKQKWWQAHPFSLSKYPDGKNIRLSIKASGDYTATIPELKPGTPVIVEGPYGIYTAKRSVKNKVLLIAGGIGITPISGVIENLATMGKNVILLYANKTAGDIALRSELEDLSTQYNFPIHHVLSTPPVETSLESPPQNMGRVPDSSAVASAKVEGRERLITFDSGFISADLIKKYTPDITDREVYLCGPPPMMAALIKTLQELGVPKKYIYYEKFSLS